MNSELDAVLARLRAVLEPRVGKKMTRVVLQHIVRMMETGADDAAVLSAMHATLDAYGRMPESGTPFSLEQARAIAEHGALKLHTLAWHQARGQLRPGMVEEELRAVGQHADLLVPTYGDDDVEFALRVAWQNAHLWRQHLVVGRAFDRNDARPVQWLRAAARDVDAAPIGVVREDVGEPGVVYASRTGRLFFSPDRGDALPLDTWSGLSEFFARVPLAITPHTLAWIVHLLRAYEPGARVDVDGGLLVDWEPLEEEPRAAPASALLGLRAAAAPARESIVVTIGDSRFHYAPGALARA